MDDEPVTVTEAAAIVEEAAVENEILSDQLENAQARVEQAEERAQEIFDAQVFTAMGQRIEVLEGRISECLGQREEAERRITALESSLTELATKTGEITGLVAGMVLASSPTTQQSTSIPPVSEPVTEPETVDKPKEEEKPVAPARRRTRLL